MSVFDDYQVALDYDRWYDEHQAVFLSEVLALRKAFKGCTRSLEVGAGTGRFTKALGISVGLEPSETMRRVASERGVELVAGRAEELPFKDEEFDCVLFITSLEFIADLRRAISEAHRVLKLGGKLIAGVIDAESWLGKLYEELKDKSKTLSEARFLRVPQLISLLESGGFEVTEIWQTLFRGLDLSEPEEPEPGWGRGGFVVISSRRRAP